jgi:hypothetical protein
MLRARLKQSREGAQWTGITTHIGERLLESHAVDAILTMTQDPNDSWKPLPILIDRAEDIAKCRGMRMGYAPLLSLLFASSTLFAAIALSSFFLRSASNAADLVASFEEFNLAIFCVLISSFSLAQASNFASACS